MNQTLANAQPALLASPVGGSKVPFSAVRNEAPGFALKRSRGDGWDAAVTEETGRLMGVAGVTEAVAPSWQLVDAAIASLDLPQVKETAMPAAATPSGPAFVLTLPEAEAGFLRGCYASASNILEYGSGGSTVLAASLGKRVISVESDGDWAARLAEELLRVGYPSVLHHVDIGPTKDWGRPRDASGAARYHRYALSVWDRPDLGEPDLVLIDGRFRAACLLAVMLRAKRPTTVLFDDYVPRRHYHAVEKLARKEETIGRMARFTVTPGAIPPDMLTEVIGWFADPR